MPKIDQSLKPYPQENILMRIAVISDVHGNDLAFEAVESDIQKQSVDQIICLGDAIQGGPQPWLSFNVCED